MKKITVLLLTVTTLLTFAACSSGPEAPASEESVPTVTPSPTDVQTPTGSLPTTPDVKEEAADENGANYVMTSGRIAYADGYTYFVFPGENNDGSDNGNQYSDDIYRIADDPSATPVLVASVPRVMIDNIAQMTVFYLTPYGDHVYYMRERNGVSGDRMYHLVFGRANVSDGATEDLFVLNDGTNVMRNGVFRTSDALCFGTYQIVENDGGYEYRTAWKKIDLRSGAVVDYLPPVTNSRTESATVCAITGGYVYYAKSAAESDAPYGVYRKPVDGGDEQEVCPLPADTERVYVFDGTVLASTNDNLVTYDVKSGKKCGTIPLSTFNREMIMNVSGNVIYFTREDGLYRIERDGTGAEQVIEGNLGERSDDILALGVSKDHFYLLDDDYMIYRFKKDARIISQSPLVTPVGTSDDTQLYNNEWEYYEYPNCVVIHAYVGDRQEVTAPQSINGKKVVRVYLAWSNRDNTLKSITVPEGVRSIGTLYGDGIEKVYLPKSLLLMSSRGYPYVFETADGATVTYAGTKAEWQTLCDNCDKMVAIDHSGAEDLTVICSDGVWSDK